LVRAIWRGLSKQNRSLGIEITDSYVRICELAGSNERKATILHYACKELEAGVVEDGKVMDWAGLEQTLRKALDAQKFSSRQVHFAIPSQMVMVRTLKLPDLSHKELRKLIRYEMNNNFSLAFEEPHYDFIKLPRTNVNEGSDENGQMRDVMVVAAPMQLLREYRELFERVGLVPASFEIAPFAIIRIADRAGYGEKDAVQMIVNVNTRQSEITIFADGYLEMTRYVDVAFESIVDKPNEHQNDWLSSFSSPEQTFQNGVLDLIAELERVMNFYSYSLNNGMRVISKLVLTGDLREMNKLEGMMKERMGLPVQMLEWQALELASTASDKWRLCEYAVTVGLALRGNER